VRGKAIVRQHGGLAPDVVLRRAVTTVIRGVDAPAGRFFQAISAGSQAASCGNEPGMAVPAHARAGIRQPDGLRRGAQEQRASRRRRRVRRVCRVRHILAGAGGTRLAEFFLVAQLASEPHHECTVAMSPARAGAAWLVVMIFFVRLESRSVQGLRVAPCLACVRQ